MQPVVVEDVNIPFGSMFYLAFKWWIANILVLSLFCILGAFALSIIMFIVGQP